jgi:hypothetical protein
MMADPYSHPQHIKVVKQLVYIWSGLGESSHEGLEPRSMPKGVILC